MQRPRLRVYHGPGETRTCHTEMPPRDEIRVPLGEIFALLADAVRSGRTWLSDFEHEDIGVSTDLYEVLLAYQHYRKPPA